MNVSNGAFMGYSTLNAQFGHELFRADRAAPELCLSTEQLCRYERITILQLNDVIEKLEEINRKEREFMASIGLSGLLEFLCGWLRYVANSG